ncbi:hypothetical protein Pelo_5669 [Pelomyxa schiedti]|nr:hypothetical protein Pelo_5669 [Pelomyxa schiedti]
MTSTDTAPVPTAPIVESAETTAAAVAAVPPPTPAVVVPQPDPQLVEGLLRDAGQAAGLGVQLDTAHDYPGAVDAYRRAAGLLSKVLEFESDPQRSQLISAKVSQYSQRAEVLAGYLGSGPTGMTMAVDQAPEQRSAASEPMPLSSVAPPQPMPAQQPLMQSVPAVLNSAIDKVKTINKEYHIQEHVTTATSTIITQASQLNQNYHISEKVSSAANTSFAKMKEIDQQYHVAERVTGAASTGINALWGWFNQGVSLVTDSVLPTMGVGPNQPQHPPPPPPQEVPPSDSASITLTPPAPIASTATLGTTGTATSTPMPNATTEQLIVFPAATQDTQTAPTQHQD